MNDHDVTVERVIQYIQKVHGKGEKYVPTNLALIVSCELDTMGNLPGVVRACVNDVSENLRNGFKLYEADYAMVMANYCEIRLRRDGKL